MNSRNGPLDFRRKTDLLPSDLQRKNDIQAILKTVEGKRFFRWFFRTFPYVMEVYTGNANTQYLAGKVAVSRTVADELSKACGDLMTPPLLREDATYGEVCD